VRKPRTQNFEGILLFLSLRCSQALTPLFHGVPKLYGILLKNGCDRVECKDCGGEGSLQIRGSLKVCKACGGLGAVPLIEEVQRVLRQFQLPANYTVSHGHSIVLKYYGYAYDDIIHALQALHINGTKARIIFPVF